jgi:hypothetical protein
MSQARSGPCEARAAEPALPVLPPGMPYLLSALADEGIYLRELAAVVQRQKLKQRT